MSDEKLSAVQQPSIEPTSTPVSLSVEEASKLLARGRELQDKLGPTVTRMMDITEDDLKVRSR